MKPRAVSNQSKADFERYAERIAATDLYEDPAPALKKIFGVLRRADRLMPGAVRKRALAGGAFLTNLKVDVAAAPGALTISRPLHCPRIRGGWERVLASAAAGRLLDGSLSRRPVLRPFLRPLPKMVCHADACMSTRPY